MYRLYIALKVFYYSITKKYPIIVVKGTPKEGQQLVIKGMVATFSKLNQQKQNEKI